MTYQNRQERTGRRAPADSLADRFREHDESCPQVWAAFERRMLEVCRAARRRGCKRVGAKMVWERMRWDSFVGDPGDEYRLNNTWTAFYARKFREAHPEFADLIETRDAAGDDAPQLFEHEDGQLSMFPQEESTKEHMH